MDNDSNLQKRVKKIEERWENFGAALLFLGLICLGIFIGIAIGYEFWG